METNQRLISFDLKAEMGFLKKPDINDGIYLTYNMLHKPALLGILGAIAGLKGYEENGKFPEYYKRLMHLDNDLNLIKGLKSIGIGIQPLPSKNKEKIFKGSYTKEIVSYNNNTGFANVDKDGAGCNLIITEQILLRPSYRCFLLLNLDHADDKTLYDNILSYKAEFLPYLGKNEFSAWWINAKEYSHVDKFDFNSNYKIASLFAKTEAVSGYVARAMGRGAGLKEPTFLYFERLPIGFDEKLYQYKYENFVYSNAEFESKMDMSEAGEFYKISNEEIIQLF